MISQNVLKVKSWLKQEEIKHRCGKFVCQTEPNTNNWHYKELENQSRVAVDCCMEYRALGAPVFTKTGKCLRKYQ